VSFVLLPNLKISSATPSSGGDIFDNPTGSVFLTFEFSGWPGTVANPITSSDFTTYNNSATSSYEFSGWPGTVASPITSSDFATYNNSATASYELGPWEFSFGTGSLSTQYEDGTSLVARWTMNDSASNTTVVDDIGGSDGTFTGGGNTDTQSTSSGNPPNLTRALTFDGISDYVDLPEGPTNTIEAAGKFTAAAWVYNNAGSLTQDRTIIGSYGSSPAGRSWLLQVDWDGATAGFMAFIRDGSNNTAVGVGQPSVLEDTWQHVAATYDGTDLKLYVDGALTASAAGAWNPEASTSTEIGRRANLNRFFDGAMDEVRIYDEALDAAGILSLYNAGAGTQDPNTPSSKSWPGTLSPEFISGALATQFTASANSASTQYELAQEWPGTLSPEFISGALATQFTASLHSASTQYELAQEWPGTLSPEFISGALATQFTASLHSASTTYESGSWPIP